MVAAPAELRPWINRVGRYLGLVQQGILPTAGGWEDQSATFCDALELLLEVQGELELADIEKGAGS